MTIGSRSVGTYQQTPHYSLVQWNGEDDPNRTRENRYQKLWEYGLNNPGEYCAKIWNRPVNGPYPWGCDPEWYLSYYPTDPVARDWNQPILKNLGKIRDDIRGHELDLGNSIAEGRETVGMALGAMRDMAKAARNLRRGNIAEAVRNLTSGAKSGKAADKNLLSDRLSSKSISDRYLGYTYGISPLLQDIYEAGKAWEEVTAGPRHKDYIRTSRGQPQEGLFIYGNAYRRYKGTYSVRHRVRVSEDASTQRKLGLLDPKGIAWELTPFSFVVDWFIPISDYLDTLNLFNGVQATVLETRRWNTTITSDGVTPAYIWDPFWGGAKQTPVCRQNFGGISRTFQSSISVPPPFFKPLEKALSPKHLLNAAALLRSALFGAFRGL